MPNINDYVNEFMGTVWAQPNGPNTAVYPLLCVDIDGIDEPQGDISRKFCKAGDGSFRVVHRTQASPSSVTFDIVAWKNNQRSYMQQQADRRCPAAYYLHHAFCGRVDTFLNYDVGKLLPNGMISSKAYSNSARGRAEENDNPEMVGQTFSLSADNPAPEYYLLLPTIGDPASEDEPLRDIAKCSWGQCVGPCGELIDVCDVMNVVADAATGVQADGYITEDNAGSFTAWGDQPFDADEDYASVVCVQISRSTTRIIIANGTTAGTPAEIAYSDDGGDNFTAVTVGVTNGEFATHSGALFALDHRHIWLCTNLANVYFSSDGGLTWTDQNAPTPGASEQLNYIHFIDENYGWSVGGFRTTPTGLFIQTTDGGEHWNLATVEPKIEMGNWVNVIDAYRVWVGLDDGTVYFSNDWGATAWTQRVLPSTLVNTGDGTFISEYEGAICGYKAGAGNGVPVVFRTFNGGYDWEEFNHTAEFANSIVHYGLNALIMCSINEIHTVGEDVGGVSLVWTLKPAGW